MLAAMQGEGVELGWRQAALDAVMLWTTRFGAVVVAVVFVSTWRADVRRLSEPGFLIVFGTYAGVVVLSRCVGLSYAQRAAGFCLLLVGASAAAIPSVGTLPGPVLAGTLAVVSAQLFLGSRAMLATLVCTSSVVVARGLREDLGQGAVDPFGGLLWLRLATGYGVMSGAIALLVQHVVSRLERSLVTTTEALRRLSRAKRERSQAEAALRATQEALQRAQKLEAVGRLAAGVGHDFNNSLQVVLSWASLLRDEEDPRLIEEGLDAIQEAALQGSELTKRLLAFGRRDVRAPSVASPRQLLEESAKSLRGVLPEDIGIELTLDQNVPTVLVDTAQISHVLLNLGLNARDAMPTGGLLTLGLSRVEDSQMPPELRSTSAGTWVQIRVRDTGMGMNQHTRAHIFEPFFTTKGERGTGLGLSTSYAMVQGNGGLFRVVSEEGRGSEFQIYLPQHGASLDVASSSKAASPPEAALVMVAEDDQRVRQSLVRVLGAAGFRVIESADAHSAMALLEQVGAEVDVLCTDGIMPGGGTRQLIDQYLSRRPQGRVILCSGYIEEELLRREIDAGAFGYLPKPFLPFELVDRVKALLAAPAPRGASAPLGAPGSPL
jgi:signal transduction histidine kinase/CheY-like chemotaxis protein